jgi:uncharacterized protein (UPF0261 family)
MDKTIAIVATLDTKGEEAKYLREEIERKGVNTLVIDDGMLGAPLAIKPGITQETVAEAAGSSFQIVKRLGRGPAAEIMSRGMAKILGEAYQAGRFDGVICGQDGALLAASGMRELPVGVPKLIVTPIAQGTEPFGNYVGTKDIMMMHSIVDILGINEISRKVFDVAVGSIVGMVEANVSSEMAQGKNMIAATMYGNTTPAVMRAKSLLEERGYEVVVFHPNGTGGRAMEELIEQGVFAAVLDMTPHEVTGELFGDVARGIADRLEVAGRKGIPQLVVPGCIDVLLLGPLHSLPSKYKKRKVYYFSSAATMVRTTKNEMITTAKVMADKLNKAIGPVVVAIPLGGFNMYCHKGEPLYDPEADMAFVRTLKEHLRPQIKVIELDNHINDPIFAETVVPAFIGMIEESSKEKT